jgi:hypothetical protein
MRWVLDGAEDFEVQFTADREKVWREPSSRWSAKNTRKEERV